MANDLDSQLSQGNIFNEQQAKQAIYLGSRRLAGQLKTALWESPFRLIVSHATRHVASRRGRRKGLN